ncbi:MAG TPA: formyltransferase family protein [Oculatellaceae cyanobacterium]|jgi:hypothetical protein
MTPPKKLSVFILSNDDLTSNLIFSPLFDSPMIEVCGVAYTTTLTNKKGGFSGALEVLKKTDFCYWLYLVLTNGFFKVFEKLALQFNIYPQGTWLSSLRVLCRKHQIPLYHSANFNSPEFLALLKEMQPDLILSRVNQILKADILSIPTHGIWGVHSSLLPSYGGIAGEFHGLRMGEKQLGTSIFGVSLKLDEGPVISQRAIPVQAKRSLFYHLLSNNLAAGQLVRQTIEALAKDTLEQETTVIPGLEPSYYSWPKPDQVRDFLKAKQRFMTGMELFRFITACLMLHKALPFKVAPQNPSPASANGTSG